MSVSFIVTLCYGDEYYVTVCLFEIYGRVCNDTGTTGITYFCVIFRRCLYLCGVVGGVNLNGSCRRRRRRAEVLSRCLITGTKVSPGCYLNRNRLGIKCLRHYTCYVYASLVTSLLLGMRRRNAQECTALFFCTDLLMTACQPSNTQQGAAHRTLKWVDSFLTVYRWALRRIFMSVRRIAKSDY